MKKLLIITTALALSGCVSPTESDLALSADTPAGKYELAPATSPRPAPRPDIMVKDLDRPVWKCQPLGPRWNDPGCDDDRPAIERKPDPDPKPKPDPKPRPDPKPKPDQPGNPGNDKPKGKAGEQPTDKDFGSGEKGTSG